MKTGIDLGTTYSLISKINNAGKAHLIPDHSDKDIFATPSAVHVDRSSALVGHLVDVMLLEDPNLPVIRFFKREFGNSKPIHFDKAGNGWYPESIAALVLKKLKYDAENSVGRNVESTVITVPAHFSDTQRKAVINASYLADIPVLGLVEEPVAAALHYGMTHKGKEQLILVYDLGGGTFDATLLSMDDNGVYVLAKDGLTDLGGKEFDELVGEYILNQFNKKYGNTIDLNAYTLLQLRRISEEVKIELSLPNKPIIKKKILLGDQVLDIIFKQMDFERFITASIDKTIEVLVRCVDGAGINIKDINALLLVGGSSMIPYVHKRLSSLLEDARQQICFHEPMKAVAYGAALHAAQLSGEAQMYDIPPEFRGITGYNIGIKTIDPFNGQMNIEVLIKKNMPLPTKSQKTFYTNKSDQRKINLQFVEFIHDASEAVTIGTLTVAIPNPRLNYPVEVSVAVSEDGLVTVTAYDPNSGLELEQQFGQEEREDGFLLEQRKLVGSVLINNIY